MLYKLDAATSSGILKAKQKLGVTFNSDKLGGIDFTKFSKLSPNVQCRCWPVLAGTMAWASSYTANISAVKITAFRCVPFPAVLSLYFLHCKTTCSKSLYFL